MAIARQFQITVGTSATELEGTEFPGWLLKNTHTTSTVYIGDENVTTGIGFPIDPETIFSLSEIAHESLRGRKADRLWAIVASGTADVRVLVSGRVNQ